LLNYRAYLDNVKNAKTAILGGFWGKNYEIRPILSLKNRKKWRISAGFGVFLDIKISIPLLKTGRLWYFFVKKHRFARWF